jgi:hypothetical protein
MPRLIPPRFGNGWRPSSTRHKNGSVPVLDVADDSHELVGAEHDAALDPDDDTQLLTGALVLLDCEAYNDGSRPGPMRVHVGGSTLHEAATEVIGAHMQLASEMPAWVAATDAALAEVLAEHYTIKGYSECEAVAMDEVPT